MAVLLLLAPCSLPTFGFLSRNSFCASSLWYTHDSCGLSDSSPTKAHVLLPFLHVFTCQPRAMAKHTGTNASADTRTPTSLHPSCEARTVWALG